MPHPWWIRRLEVHLVIGGFLPLHSPHTHWSWTCWPFRERGSFFSQESVLCCHTEDPESMPLVQPSPHGPCPHLSFWGPLVDSILMDHLDVQGCWPRQLSSSCLVAVLGGWCGHQTATGKQIPEAQGLSLHQLKSTNISLCRKHSATNQEPMATSQAVTKVSIRWGTDVPVDSGSGEC